MPIGTKGKRGPIADICPQIARLVPYSVLPFSTLASFDSCLSTSNMLVHLNYILI